MEEEDKNTFEGQPHLNLDETEGSSSTKLVEMEDPN